MHAAAPERAWKRAAKHGIESLVNTSLPHTAAFAAGNVQEAGHLHIERR
jgi:hypothetical protein